MRRNYRGAVIPAALYYPKIKAFQAGTYPGTLLIVSHDLDVLRNCVDTLWHIDNGKIQLFSGNIDNYQRELQILWTSNTNTMLRKISS